MFQVEKRANAVNFNPAEIDRFNTQITELAVKYNTSFTSVKEVLTFAITELLSAKQPEITIPEPVLPDNAVILGENDLVITQTESFKSAFDKFSVTEYDQDKPSTPVLVLTDALNIAMQEPKIKEIEVEKEVEKPLTEHQVLLDLSAQEHLVLGEIARRRFQAGRVERLLEPSETIRKIVFSKAVLFNWAGEYWTGIEKSDFKN